MSWALHYRVSLARELSVDDAAALAAVCQRHGFTLRRVVHGVEGFEQWRGLVPDEELERLKRLELARPRTRLDDADFGDFVPLRDHAQLLRLVRWLRDVEDVLPFDEFEVSEDFTITSRCRPSEVDLAELERLAAQPKKRRRKRARPSSTDERPSTPEEEAMLATAREEVEQADRTLEEARREFARWKARRS